MVDNVATIVLRLVGAATLIGHQTQPGEAKLHSCIGGYGPLAATPEDAAAALLAGRPVRIAADDEQAVRSVLAARAMDGWGPDGEGKNWSAEWGTGNAE